MVYTKQKTVFHITKNASYTIMSHHHLWNRELPLKTKDLLSKTLGIPEKWDYTLQGMVNINPDQINALLFLRN